MHVSSAARQTCADCSGCGNPWQADSSGLLHLLLCQLLSQERVEMTQCVEEKEEEEREIISMLNIRVSGTAIEDSPVPGCCGDDACAISCQVG